MEQEQEEHCKAKNAEEQVYADELSAHDVFPRERHVLPDDDIGLTLNVLTLKVLVGLVSEVFNEVDCFRVWVLNNVKRSSSVLQLLLSFFFLLNFLLDLQLFVSLEGL